MRRLTKREKARAESKKPPDGGFEMSLEALKETADAVNSVPKKGYLTMAQLEVISTFPLSVRLELLRMSS